MDNQTNNTNDSKQLKKVMHQIISVVIKHRKVMDNLLQSSGVYSSQHYILMELSRNQFRSQKELADKLDVSSATVAVSLKKLEKGGYVNKEVSFGDNRLKVITPTEKGLAVAEQSKKIFKSADIRVFEGFDQKELEELSRLLDKLNNNLEEIDKNPKGT